MSHHHKPMITIGIDSVAVHRFDPWKAFDNRRLSKVFSHEEIQYARSNELFFSQRLAARFAAKEAFLKAFQQFYPDKKLRFLTVAQSVHVCKNESGMPYLEIKWDTLYPFKNTLQTSLSLTHEKCHATAVVIIHD